MLVVCVVDHGVNEGEPVDEQYREQVCEDQYRDPEPEGQYLDQVKLHTSAELKPIRIAVPTVLGELRFCHTTSVSSGNGWAGVSCFGKVSGSCVVCYGG